MKRDWSKILIDAALRNLGTNELARELGVWPGSVANAAKRYGIKLAYKNLGRKLGTKFPNSHAKQRARTARIWTDRFANSAGLTLNEFCRRYKTSVGAAAHQARLHGHKFAPSDARAKYSDLNRKSRQTHAEAR